jgi:glycosyltransferase involved in cell wall biosynthesis
VSLPAPASVVVACYNQGDVLPLALAGLASQRTREIEVILADDGSREDYEPLLREWSRRFAHGIQLVRHEDKGFRKTRILNRAVRVSRFERLVFTDADCVPHPAFVPGHVGHLSPRTAVTGRRAHLSRDAFPPVEEILARGMSLGLPRLFALKLAGRASVVEHGFFFPFFSEAPGAGILGSNFSVLRDDLVAINGFNEEYEDWGTGEDTDVDLRLRLSGVRVRAFRTTLVQYHVAHGGEREASVRSRAILDRTRKEGRARAAVGLAEMRPGDFEHIVHPPA